MTLGESIQLFAYLAMCSHVCLWQRDVCCICNHKRDATCNKPNNRCKICCATIAHEETPDGQSESASKQ